MARLSGLIGNERTRVSTRTLVTAVVCALATVAVAEEVPLSARVTSYRIDARLDPAARTVTAHQHLRWRNLTAVAATDLYFHLYLNAFANNRTALMREVPDRVEWWTKRFPDEWGGIDVTAIHLRGADVTNRLEPVAGPGDNPFDRTVARLPLDRPVPPGGEVEVDFEFAARLPHVFMRSGHAAPFFFVAQWFPKLGVFENGHWTCRPYYATTEFFADFGTYDVRLTVPSDYVVGHTGINQGEQDNGDGTKTVVAHADDVHDFAWAADPRFRVTEEEIGQVQVRLLMQPGHVAQAQRYLDALRVAMARYTEWFGPYPYPVLTVVDPGPGGLAAGGMEYPMLITVGTTWWMPEGLRWPERVAVHEFGHQYWYGIVANNELDDAWMDEGINSYVEGRIMDDVYGPATSYLNFLGLHVGSTAYDRLTYLAAPSFDPLTRPAYEMLDAESYRSVTYAKTALVLDTLDRRLGGDRLRDALRSYYRAWRFRHPTAADWRTAITRSVGEDLDRFFAQTLDGTGVLDYSVVSIDVREVPPAEGIGVPPEETGHAGESARYRSEVIVGRLGDVQMPVEIAVVFENGGEMRETWDGIDRWHRLESVGTQRAEYAVVDPGEKLPLDVDRLNNSRMEEPAIRGIVRLAGRWGLWLQSLLHVLTSI